MSRIIPSNTDIVFHCAATAYEGLSVFSPSFVTKNIFDATVTTLTASIKNNLKSLFSAHLWLGMVVKVPF